MTAVNDITGAPLRSPPPTDAYREGHDRIFDKCGFGRRCSLYKRTGECECAFWDTRSPSDSL